MSAVPTGNDSLKVRGAGKEAPGASELPNTCTTRHGVLSYNSRPSAFGEDVE